MTGPEDRAHVATADIFQSTAVHDAQTHTASERVRVQDTLALIPEGTGSLLEVGAGTCVLVNGAQVARKVAVDAARRGLRLATCPTAQASILQLPFADRAFDVVLCAETLEHLPPELLAPAARELRRVARRAVIVTTPWKERLAEGVALCPDCGTEFHLHGHLNSLGPDELAPLFPDATRVDVKGSWRVRPYSPALLAVRHRVFGQRPWSRHSLCPHCRSNRLPKNDRRVAWRVLSALNTALHPRRSQFNWVLLRAWFSPEDAR